MPRYTTHTIQISIIVNIISFEMLIYITYAIPLFEKSREKVLCASAAITCFSVTAESKGMLYIPLQRNTI